MGNGGDPFGALFLDQVAVPVGMRRIHMVDGVPLLRPESAARALRSGTVIWLDEPDADLYRLDDSRWVMRSRQATAALFRDLSSQLHEAGGVAGDVRADEGIDDGTDEAMEATEAVEAGRPGAHSGRVTAGTPDGGFVHLARVGVVVIRVATTPGEHTSVARAVAEDLGAQAEARVGTALATHDAQTLAGSTRLARLRLPARWRRARRGAKSPEESG